jgi:putative SOS response-associated peptidase YedK
MCKRFAVPDHVVAEREFLPARSWWNFAAKFNVAPPQYVPAIRQDADASEAAMMRWGLIPSSTQGQPAVPGILSVEVDQMERGEVFRSLWLNSQRCILPVSGFYVWQLTMEKYRQPFFIRLIDRPVFGLAAIWDRWVSEDDDVIESCSLVRVPANELMADVNNTDQCMPAILRRKDYDRWLRGTPVEAKTALQPYEALLMQAYAVSPRINSIAHDDFGLIQPIH